MRLSLVEELEARIRATSDSTESLPPEVREMWLAYGDLLLEQGDRRGMAIALYDRLLHSKIGMEQLSYEEKTEMWQRYAALSRPAEEELPFRAAIYPHKWHCGFVRSAVFRGSDAWSAFEALCGHPCGRLLSRVAFDRTGDDIVRRLIDSKLLGRLYALSLSGLYLRDEAAIALIRSPGVASLIELNLNCNGLTSRTAEAIANATSLSSLVKLDLSHNYIDNKGAKALAEPIGLGKLTEMDLSDNQIADSGASALHRSSLFSRLEVLLLERNRITRLARPSKQRLR